MNSPTHCDQIKFSPTGGLRRSFASLTGAVGSETVMAGPASSLKRWTAGLILGLTAAAAPAGRAGPAGPAPREPAWASLPDYAPASPVRGVIRLWGHGSAKIDFMRRLVDRWTREFRRCQPGVRIEYRMYGTASAIGALYTGAGDLALLGEEVFPFEAAAYERARGYPPGVVEVATGSRDVRNFDFAQMVFVNRRNPLRQIDLAQLDAVWGTERRRGAPREIRTWGDLGLTGAWAARPIHRYAWSFDNDFWIYLGQAMLGGSHRLNPEIRGFAHLPRPDGTLYDAGQQILDALARDPDGIALSNARYGNPEVRALAVAEPGGTAYEATEANLIARRYPLTRVIPAVFNQPPGQPVAPAVKEFIRYLLSREGQRAIAEDGEYLPLDPAAARAGAARVEAVDRATLRIRGDDAMARLIGLWEEGYSRCHPEARFENQLQGSGTGIAGLYTGTGDVAFLGRPILPVETMAFTWVRRYPPLGRAVAQGSRDVPGKSPAFAILVNRANPLRRVTLLQLDDVLDAECRRGGAPVTRWGQLGLAGDWADRPVRVALRSTGSNTTDLLRDRVFLGGRKWQWDRVVEFEDGRGPDGRIVDADRRIADAVAADAGLIGIGNARYAGPETRVVPLADGVALSRTVYAYVDRPPGQPADRRIASFLDYVAGPQGQAAVRREGDFRPLDSGIDPGVKDRLK